MNIQEQGFWVGLQNREHKFHQDLTDKQDKLSRDLLQKQLVSSESIFKQQSALTRELHRKHTKTIYIIAGIATVTSIFATLIGIWLGFHLKTTKPPELPQLTPKTETTISGTKSPEIQAASVLRNVSSPNPTLNQTTNRGSDSDKVTKKKLGN